MPIRNTILASCCVVGLVLSLAACGVTGGSTANEPGGNATPTPTGGNGGGTPAPDKVTVLLDKAQYGVGDTFTISVVNRVATPITASDHQSACSIVTVQVERNGAWVNIGKCLQGKPTQRITLAANATTTIAMAPGVMSLAANTTWQAGTYRAV
ncbi:MAG: hypothetical protein H0X24_02180, partial [Ktedonobacterales bacterium]|nr:hypothetical protein [Ktedonobacterales bacterium]